MNQILKRFDKRNAPEDPGNESGEMVGSGLIDMSMQPVAQAPVDRGDDEESLLNIELIQRMKAMHDLEDEITQILHIKNSNAKNLLAAGAKKEFFEDDCVEKVRVY